MLLRSLVDDGKYPAYEEGVGQLRCWCKMRGAEADARIQSALSFPGHCISGQNLSSHSFFLSLPTIILTSDAFISILLKLSDCTSQGHGFHLRRVESKSKKLLW